MKFGYYGNFNKYWSTETYIADALERAGHTVYRINRGKTKLVDCDYIIFAKLFNDDIILKARKKGIPSVCWVFDLFREGYRNTDIIPYLRADIVITVDPDDKYHTIRQAVHKPEKIMFKKEKKYDVIFVGNLWYKERKEMIERVKPDKIVRHTRGLALNKLLGQTKIVLGDSYPASGCWSNRIYEITGRGGFIIHPKNRDLYKYIPQFERGKEKEMIQYYLEYEEEREKLRKIQFKNCPTYDDRIKELIELLNNLKE